MAVIIGRQPLSERVRRRPYPEQTMPIASASSGKRPGNGWARAIFGLAIVGVLVVALVLVQRGIFPIAQRDISEPPPPLAAKVDQGYRGPLFVQPVPIRAVQTEVASEPAIKTATAKSRARPAQATKPRHNLAHDPFAGLEPEAVAPRVETCDQLEGMDLARCMRPQILDADQQLRTAYNDAVQSGVEKRQLAAHRRQWKKLRKRANSDPRGVLAGYRQMALQLDAARASRRAEDSECRVSGGVCAVPNE